MKCQRCGTSKSLSLLRREIAILQGFYQLHPAYRLAQDFGIDVNMVTRVYQRLREVLFYLTELEGEKLKGEIGLNEAYFGERCKGKRGRAAAGKRVVFRLLERESRVYTKVVESMSVEELMKHIQAKTRKGSVYLTDAFRGYQSLKRYRKHHTINHSRAFVSQRYPRNHMNGIEGFWSYAKHILYQYRGISNLKEIEYRFKHRTKKLLKHFLRICFDYVSP